MIKQAAFRIKGMNRDLSASAFNPEYAYENKNIRILSTNANTQFSITNEKGNKYSEIKGIGDLEGVPIGQSVLNNELVVFTTGAKPPEIYTEIKYNSLEIPDIKDIFLNIKDYRNEEDKIYKLWFENGELYGENLFSGDLNFNYKNPIEALSFYENDNLKKVYWVDGLNQPRFINIAATTKESNKWNNNSFNFVPRLNLQEKVSIERNLIANGIFPPGIIQYAFTYFNKYGVESNIFYTSPLYYISYNNRGASPEDKVGNSFDIIIKNLESDFDYVRIYSIIRTSINATPECKRVVDLAPTLNSITNKYEIKYTDNGTTGEIIDPTELLFVGGEETIFGTISQKDNTLFLGDMTVKRKIIDKEVKDKLSKKIPKFSLEEYRTSRTYESPNPKGFYPYENMLKYSSNKFKTFKYLETYRLGVQFQHYTGKWSEPIWINDIRNTVHVKSDYTKQGLISIPTAYYDLSEADIIAKLKEDGFVKARPVIVFPTLTDRECICQGILCPTVFNVEDRFGNSPFAQSSWFTRANAPYDLYKAFHHHQVNGEWRSDWIDRDDGSSSSINSRAGVMANNTTKLIIDEGNSKIMDVVNKGAWAEFRHYFPIPANDKRNAEIQCICDPKAYPVLNIGEGELSEAEWASQNSENFYIDQSIVTLHSPDIEFNEDVKNVDTSGLKLRIVGIVPLTSFVGDIDIQTSTPPNNYMKHKDSDDSKTEYYNEIAPGFYKEPISAENISHFGFKGLISGAFWIDDLSGYKDNTSNPKKLSTGFVVYPWHRNGSLNNCKFAKDGYKSAMLDKKRMSNMRYSYNTHFLEYSEDPNINQIWNAYESKSDSRTGISGISIFDSNEVSLVRLPAPKNSELPDINYYGNIDKVIKISRVGEIKKDGYPIMTTISQDASLNSHMIFRSNYTKVREEFTDQITGTDPIRMKYKSTPHAVMAFNYTIDGYVRALPILRDSDLESEPWDINNNLELIGTSSKLFWEKNRRAKGWGSDVLNIPMTDFNGTDSLGPEYGWLWLGEIYNDNVKNRFGGQTEEAFENNLWLPAGEAVTLNEEKTILKWTEGDTYYQRYDHIKTYPFTLQDQNSVTDIVSFMCETRVNLDGRYDKNRGQTNNFAITPENFNKMNEVYSQDNNFFSYRSLNYNKLNLDNFHNSITWTKTKTAGELVDTWTNITLASTLDLDGDKGDVRALRRFNNSIIAFQDKGISQVLYNENVQIQSSEGVPIEIANSGKVQGKRYITDKVGCTNKWSISESPMGLYFIDDITKGIYLFNGQVTNISDNLGFHSWVDKTSNISLWNPIDFTNAVSYYDKVNNDVLFIYKDNCLAFSEPLKAFSSFYSYEDTPYYINLEDKGIWFKPIGDITKAWLHNEGNYNMYFEKYKPFYVDIIANPNPTTDKIFNTLEFRSDTFTKDNEYLKDETFDTIHTRNEYQDSGEVPLYNNINKPSNLKKKFRIWRANIPRDSKNHRDRMRNPWLYIKLLKNNENVNKTILHDMVVHYFE